MHVRVQPTIRRWVAGVLLAGAAFSPWALAGLVGKHRTITESDRSFWSFSPVKAAPPPPVHDPAWCRNEVDRFVLARLESEGLTPAPEADRTTLIRRASFDLIGLPPTPEEVAAFVADPSPDAYEKLIDRLLASPKYGEHWARHWLDLVRYSESDGFKQDAYRPNAWPYRDYVIRSLNADKPYTRFVQEQIAGDELWPDDADAMIATGYLRHGCYEYNNRDVPRAWTQTLTDLTDVTGDVFLGLSMACARCHDHKFDPILQTDYFRLQAFFAPVLPRNDLPLASADQKAQYERAVQEWQEKTAEIRAKMEPMEKAAAEAAAKSAIKKFPEDIQAIIRKPASERTPLEEQWAQLALRQVHDPNENAPLKMSAKDKPKYAELQKELSAFDGLKPKPPMNGLFATDVGPVAPPTIVPGHPDQPLEPGVPVVLENAQSKLEIVATKTSTGRRTVLARWLIDPSNPLPARVMVNRVWQYHFGRGLVATASDFGHLGTPPTHPELLDFLARDFVKQGWSLKKLHRLIMTSSTYRQSALRPAPEIARMKDPEDRWLWRMNTRRLNAEQIRDSMLQVSGELTDGSGGPSVEPSVPRRSIYTRQLRNHPDAMLEAFDTADSFASVCTRNVTTTSTQALLMINGDWPLKRAEAFAKRVRSESNSSDTAVWINTAYRIAYSRPPKADERALGIQFLGSEGDDEKALTDFCHVLLNSNEFLYAD